MPRPSPDTPSSEPWRCLYRNDRISRVRFVQYLCWVHAVVCAFLLLLALRGPDGSRPPIDAGERIFVVVTCILAIVLPNAGMALYLGRYVVCFEVSGDQARLTTPGYLLGGTPVVLPRSEFRSIRPMDGALTTGLTVSVYAPWTWVTTRHVSYILDDQCPGGSEVLAWVAGRAPDSPGRPDA